MNYIIPQDFDQSDKIGKLSMPQAVVLGIGATIFVLIVVTSSLWVSLLSLIPIGLLTLLFMFMRINKVPLYEFVLIYALYIGTPKLLIFRSDNLKSFEDKEDEIGFIEYQKREKKQESNKEVAKSSVKSSKEKRLKGSKKPVKRKKRKVTRRKVVKQ